MNELLVFIGIILFMSLYVGCSRQDFFSDAEINLLNGAPVRLTAYMSGRKFNSILKALTFTSSAPPVYKDKFWEVCRLIKEWNQHMYETFILS